MHNAASFESTEQEAGCPSRAEQDTERGTVAEKGSAGRARHGVREGKAGGGSHRPPAEAPEEGAASGLGGGCQEHGLELAVVQTRLLSTASQSHSTPWSAGGSHWHSPQRGRPMKTMPQRPGRRGQRNGAPDTGVAKAYLTLGPMSHLLRYVQQDG